MSEETAQKLEKLIGKTKMYKGKKTTFKLVKEVGQVITIKTDGRTLSFLPSELDLFFSELKDVPVPTNKHLPAVTSENKNLPISSNANAKKGIVINGYEPSADNIVLKSSLMDVLKELNTGATDENMKKARSICEVANTMVNIQKAETQLINAIKR